MKFTKCGNKNEKYAISCAKCGTACACHVAQYAKIVPIQNNAAPILAPNHGATPSNKGKIITSLILIVAILILVIACRSSDNVSADVTTNIGDIVEFGGYEWLVLDIQDGKALLLSENILEWRAYHTEFEDTTWARSLLRHYLNGEFFSRFTAAEQEKVMETEVANSDNPWFSTDGGTDTSDKVFLLSIDEAARYFGDSGRLRNWRGNDAYWIDDEYNQARIAYPHEDLDEQVPEGWRKEDWESFLEQWGGASWWWLRSPGFNSSIAAHVHANGWLGVNGRDVGAVGGVRPALWLDMQS